MKSNITVGIDVGSFNIRVAVVEHKKGKIPRVLGTGISTSRGLRQGYITDPENSWNLSFFVFDDCNPDIETADIYSDCNV